MTTKRGDIWDEFEDIFETCRMKLSDLRELVRTASEVRAAGSCQCGDDEACKFVREKDKLREVVAAMLPWMMRMTPPALIGTARAAVDGVELDDGWVSADASLPGPDKPVLTYDATSGKQVVAWWWEAGGRWLSAGKMTHVTHWQPLPDPPKDEEEG